MTRKEQIQRMIAKLPDDVTYDRVMYHLDVMKAIEIGLEQAERGEVIDHDELFDRLEKEDAERPADLDARSRKRSARRPAAHQSGRSTDSSKVHKTPPKRSRKA